MDFGFRILDFGFTERFGFCIRLFYYTPTRVGGFVAKISMKYAKIDTLENVFGGNHFVGWVVAFCSDLLRVFYKWKSVCRPGMTGPINFFWISLDRGATFLRMAGLRAGIHQNVLRVLDSWGRTRIYLYRFERGTIPVAHTHTHTHVCMYMQTDTGNCRSWRRHSGAFAAHWATSKTSTNSWLPSTLKQKTKRNANKNP